MVRSRRNRFAQGFRRLDDETLLKVVRAFDVDAARYEGSERSGLQINREVVIQEIVGLQVRRLVALAAAIALMLLGLVTMLIRRG